MNSYKHNLNLASEHDKYQQYYMEEPNITKPKKIPDAPALKEAHWFGMAVALVVITTIIVLIAAIYVFQADTTLEKVQRAQAFMPFGAALLALVTFCTVAWRGVVTTRQADEQKRQNDAKDEENLAKLLIDGTKMIAKKCPVFLLRVQPGKRWQTVIKGTAQHVCRRIHIIKRQLPYLKTHVAPVKGKTSK